MLLIAESLSEYDLLLRRLAAIQWLLGPSTAISIASQGYEPVPVRQAALTPNDQTREH